MSLFHKHQWRVDRAFVRQYISGNYTMLSIQCETCGKVKEHTAARTLMTSDQLSNYIMARFNQYKQFQDTDKTRRIREGRL